MTASTTLIGVPSVDTPRSSQTPLRTERTPRSRLMPWECASGVADDCVEEDLFDPPYQRGEAAICGPCARELGLKDS